ncbi:taurine catabolism dioxygenase TauD, TfdA family-domain-containing protein [Bisporella sp. PMI_857]|nr:taurine catabolism dioxygenase TauD, TfdA family-domain-containing protein [Bisporella sp. PMI_857]
MLSRSLRSPTGLSRNFPSSYNVYHSSVVRELGRGMSQCRWASVAWQMASTFHSRNMKCTIRRLSTETSPILHVKKGSSSEDVNQRLSTKLLPLKDKEKTTGEGTRLPYYRRLKRNLKTELLHPTWRESAGHWWEAYHPFFIRDSCTCVECVDPYSKQKNFQSTDIPVDIQLRHLQVDQEKDLAHITWLNDVSGFGETHTTTVPLSGYQLPQTKDSGEKYSQWDNRGITQKLRFVNYEDYISADEALCTTLEELNKHGLIILRGVPESETAVEKIANRIGKIRDTFYGLTWDVKSKPQAENVAYTAKYLGLHMDLLYMENPPGFQFLHCIKNTCHGGNSIFSDAYKAAMNLSRQQRLDLRELYIPYHYENAGQHYSRSRPVLERRERYKFQGKSAIANQEDFYINYSPPFQNQYLMDMNEEVTIDAIKKLETFRKFVTEVESDVNLHEYRLQEGECVIFNNRRVLHGRRQFDTGTGERWLKGTYIDTDVLTSRWRVLRAGKSGKELARFKAKYAGYVHPKSIADHNSSQETGAPNPNSKFWF